MDAQLHGDLAPNLTLCSAGSSSGIHEAKQQKALHAVGAGGLSSSSGSRVSKRKEALEGVPQGLRLSVVAGTGFEPVTFRL